LKPFAPVAGKLTKLVSLKVALVLCPGLPGDRVEVAPDRYLPVATDAPAGRLAQVVEAEADAQRPAEAVVGDDDPRFDQDLAHRDVDLGDQPLDFFELGRDVGDEELVGPGFEHHGAARREDARRAAGGAGAAGPCSGR
jgi:hypothetical protein